MISHTNRTLQIIVEVVVCKLQQNTTEIDFKIYS